MTALASENFRPFAWTKAKAEAAILLAENVLPDVQIAARAEVSDRQLRTWKQHPDFVARVAEHVAEFEASTLRYQIAKRRKRVEALNRRWLRLQDVVDARAAAYGDDPKAGAPGAGTGLLVRQYKSIRSGTSQLGDPEYETVEEWVVDTALLKEIREHEKQAAQEVGQWDEKPESGGEGIQRVYVGVRVEVV